VSVEFDSSSEPTGIMSRPEAILGMAFAAGLLLALLLKRLAR
jgi:hypothetical protein